MEIVVDICDHEINLIIGKVVYDDSQINEILLNLLNSNNFDKQLNVYIKSSGGSSKTMRELLFAFKNYKNITTYLMSCAHSAGSFLFLAGKERIADKFSVFMAHPPKILTETDFNKTQNYVSFKMKRLEKIAFDLYKPYFTEQEIKEIMYEGKEFYLDANEMLNRGIATKII